VRNKNSYSQHGEDILVMNYFNNRKGTFLDLGANDGITLSNTFLFYLNNWKGLMVEGSPFVFDRLKKNFESDNHIQCLNICLSDKEGYYDFYHNINHNVNPNIDKENMDLLSTIDEYSFERTKNWGSFEKHKIWCHTFDEVIKRSNYETFDLISIDIEGMDFKVLNQIDLNKTKTECLIIEYNNNIEEMQKIINYSSVFGLSNILLDNKTNIILTK
jgi:FkbM family methyltransferase